MKEEYVKYWLETPEESAGFLFWQVTNLWHRKMNMALKELDLTHVQFSLLSGIAWLERFDEDINQVKLAKHAKTNIMMTSKVIRTLEKKDLILREECESDTRAKCLSLTDEGRQRIEKALTIVEGIHEEFFKDISGKPEFIENLNRILQSNNGEMV
ncbi:MarR family transcriptional regulator [uncultured Methanobacterium sp.]|uniref:MarR family winged helix-turn-helix transcriptional regulator n=1 Tax=uncultured Methanobacterium sp. TaxID=176306 RepID=UPI002AA83F03|nr:MarR family transcriptional regulator [uncultured Methanobacterium sp.]